MKVIGLLPVRNDAWILRTTLPQLKRFVDEFIVLDGHSTDRTPQIVAEFGGQILIQQGESAQYSFWRQTLLDAGRQRGGTHFVWLDADEAFTTNFQPRFRQRLAEMRPGQKLVLDWICLWKDPRQMQADGSVRKANPKDFVFCDDHVSGFETITLHEGRTPGLNEEPRFVRIQREEGAVLHFQFVPFERFQMKQAYQRCREWVLRNAKPWDINARYAITLDDPKIVCDPIPADWLAGLQGLNTLAAQDSGWFYPEILNYFQEYGMNYFEPLDIWHITELREIFVQRMNRDPRPTLKPPFPVRFKRTLVRKMRERFSTLVHHD